MEEKTYEESGGCKRETSKKSKQISEEGNGHSHEHGEYCQQYIFLTNQSS